jgi:hypothetical protein
MHELSGIFGQKDIGFIMALDAFSLRDMAVPLNHIVMASLAFHSPCNILPVVKTPAFDLDIPFGFNVAGSATSYCARDAFLFPFQASTIKVTYHTIGLVNRQMGPLDELSMTAGASQFHPPF